MAARASASSPASRSPPSSSLRPVAGAMPVRERGEERRRDPTEANQDLAVEHRLSARFLRKHGCEVHRINDIRQRRKKVTHYCVEKITPDVEGQG